MPFDLVASMLITNKNFLSSDLVNKLHDNGSIVVFNSHLNLFKVPRFIGMHSNLLRYSILIIRA